MNSVASKFNRENASLSIKTQPLGLQEAFLRPAPPGLDGAFIDRFGGVRHHQFRIGNQTRGGKTEALWLCSGDVVLMGGDARLTYHGVDRIKPGSSSLLRDGGRINLTLRVVD